MKINKKTLVIILVMSFVVAAFTYINKTPAEDFLTSLDTAQLKKVKLPFDHLSRQAWHFLPGSMWPRAGIMLKDLNRTQKQKVFVLLRQHLSESGFEKIMSIMDLENVMAKMGQDATMRDPEKYFVAIYGNPVEDKLWAWSFEGHHISLNFTITNKKVSMTPRFLGAAPAIIPSGYREGERTLAEEDDMGLALINSMSTEQRVKTIFSSKPYYEIVTSNATEVGPLSPIGIAMRELNEQQQNQLKELITVYLSTMPEPLAQQRMKQIELEDFSEIRFGWAGATVLGEGHYYRIQGATFLIEFDNTVGNANHIHTVWRDFNGDFGKDIIKEHYSQESHY
jgi:hypothetical protein